jgi:tellurite resistance protein
MPGMEVVFSIILQSLPIIIKIMTIAVSTMISVMGALLPVCISRAKKIPNHIETLCKLFSHSDLNNQAKIYLAVILIGITGIIPFIVFSFIPFTGTALISMLTVPLAIMLSFLMVCLSYELVIIPIMNNQPAIFKPLESEILSIKEDYLKIKSTVGPKWDKFSQKASKYIEKHAENIKKMGKEADIQINRLCEYIEESITPSLNELKICIDSNSITTLSKNDIEMIQEKMAAWQKVGLATIFSLSAGTGVAVATQSVLVPTSLTALVANMFGMGSGVVVGVSTYALMTVYAPIAVGGVTFLMAIKGFKSLEKIKLSKFMSDVIISAIPMVYADGIDNNEERLLIEKLKNNPVIQDKDKARIDEAYKSKVDLNYVINNHLMHEKNIQKFTIKKRLLLSIIWSIAKADGKMHPNEIKLHNEISKIFEVEENYCEEVRRLLPVNSEMLLSAA